MLFSSITFLYFFLPLLIIIYFLIPNKFKNLILLIFSLIFYFLGEPKYIFILLLSCIVNYIIGKFIEKYKYKKILLIIGIIFNVSLLFVFKYTDFFIENFNNLFNSNIPFTYIIMPIGISFFTFQALSYIIDIYNKKHKSADNIIDFMTYICLFPQLIAGPIVRYSTIDEELRNRKVTFDKFSSGIKRFIIGLSKKVLIANVLGELITLFYEGSVVSAWLNPILFTLQIYFDFSGYSDMAIGLGLIFGFTFLENFNYPLIASSITDFWRRWHISLSSWFKDYVYIPLGGNRVNKLRWIRNIFVVWFLTGLWHGAEWNFIIWGLYFGIILLIEKLFLGKIIEKTKILKYFYTSFLIIISFLIFSTTTVSSIVISLKDMFFMSDIPFINNETIYYLKSYLILIIISLIASTPLIKNLISKLKNYKLISFLEPIFYLGLLILCTSFLISLLKPFNCFFYYI